MQIGAWSTSRHGYPVRNASELSKYGAEPHCARCPNDVELRFDAHFTVTIIRMTDDKETLVLRTVNQPNNWKCRLTAMTAVAALWP